MKCQGAEAQVVVAVCGQQSGADPGLTPVGPAAAISRDVLVAAPASAESSARARFTQIENQLIDVGCLLPLRRHDGFAAMQSSHDERGIQKIEDVRAWI